MDLGLQLLILVIFGIVGFITEKIWGLNLYKIFSDISTALFLMISFFFVFPISTNPNVAIKNLENFLVFFVNSLPTIIIGDAAGTIVSILTGDQK